MIFFFYMIILDFNMYFLLKNFIIKYIYIIYILLLKKKTLKKKLNFPKTKTYLKLPNVTNPFKIF